MGRRSRNKSENQCWFITPAVRLANPTAKAVFQQQVRGLSTLACSPPAKAQNEPSLHGFMNDHKPSQDVSKYCGRSASILVTYSILEILPHTIHFSFGVFVYCKQYFLPKTPQQLGRMEETKRESSIHSQSFLWKWFFQFKSNYQSRNIIMQTKDHLNR